MKRIALGFVTLVLLAGLSGPALAAPPLHKTSGGGTFVLLPTPFVTGTLSFSAQQLDQENNARGHFTLQDRPVGYPANSLAADLSYMKTEGNIARAAGVITRSTFVEGCWPGQGFILIVKDASPDEVGYGCSPDVATAIMVVEQPDHLYDPPWLTITHGNVKVS
ncbi:MAG: hypothetical protein LUO96_05800 [Methanomicrobiales archaeon]|nr:hypothetical protein [Methanomicrobiales archaeon]